MFLSRHYEGVGQMPYWRFVSTYRGDCTPFSEHHVKVKRLRLGSDAGAASPLISPLQTGHDFWSTFYKTTNSEYGSPVCSQSGGHAAHVLGADGSTLIEARTQDTAAKEVWPIEERGQVHYVFNGNALTLQQAQDEPQRKVELLYEEGVIASTHVYPACCKDQVQPSCGEVGLHYLLHLPVVSSHSATIKGVENVDNNASLMGLTVCGPRSSIYLQPFPGQCSCCACKTEPPYSSCFQMQTFPPCIHPGGTQPVAPAQSGREPVLTEYQASFTAQWSKPKIQLSSVYLHHHHILHQSL